MIEIYQWSETSHSDISKVFQRSSVLLLSPHHGINVTGTVYAALISQGLLKQETA